MEELKAVQVYHSHIRENDVEYIFIVEKGFHG
jgi:hypothetical protein